MESSIQGDGWSLGVIDMPSVSGRNVIQDYYA